MKIDKASVKALQVAMSEHAKGAGAALGWEGLEAGGSRALYDPSTGEIKVTLLFKVKTEEQERSGFTRTCALFGLKPEAYGTILHLGPAHAQYKLVGFDLGRRRFPVVTVQVATGKTMLWEAKVLDKVPAELRVQREVTVVDFVPRPKCSNPKAHNLNGCDCRKES